MGQVVWSTVVVTEKTKQNSLNAMLQPQATALNIAAETPMDSTRRYATATQNAFRAMSICNPSTNLFLCLFHFSDKKPTDKNNVSCVQCLSRNETPMKDLKSKTGHKAHNTMYA